MRIRHIQIKNFRGIKSLSWSVSSNFNCIIGPGDACKTTILAGLDYALTSRPYISFEDADFFNQNVAQDIVIQVTLSEWDETNPKIASFFSENKFARYKCGLDSNGPLPEPVDNGPIAVSVSLRVDKTLEPQWSIVRGHDEGGGVDRRSITGAERAMLGVSRLDVFADSHFTWGRNTLLTRFSGEGPADLSGLLSEMARTARQNDLAAHDGIVACRTAAGSVQTESGRVGVKLNELSPKLDIQKQSMSAGALSLYEGDIPLRNKGSGSKKLISCAMQMKMNNGKNVSMIDEVEIGLEPHRIRGLLHKLKNSGQQIFITTHSPVVLRELSVANNELHICKSDGVGGLSLASLNTVTDIQGPIRSNAEAFLGRKIIACEGATEIGCLRAYDLYRLADGVPVWTLDTSYYNCGGASKIKTNCPQLIALGYKVAALCDNDAPTDLTMQDVTNLQTMGVHICQWETGNSTEKQLFKDLPWTHMDDLLTKICEAHDTLDRASAINEIRRVAAVNGHTLSDNFAGWSESAALREEIAKVAVHSKWIKRIDYAEAAFTFALPLLPPTSVIKTKLNALWNWVQNDG